jgi:ubiquinone/menaquinone biosynthesis C-methylase UbiE
MLVHMSSANSPDLAAMPRGGPDASWLDRMLQTDRPEYLDRDDVDDGVKLGVITTLERLGSLIREHQRNAHLVLEQVCGVADPAILELGAGHGALSRVLLEEHPTARVTVSDVNAESVAAMASSDLGRHPRAEVRTIDATNIDARDGAFDVAVFALSFHHLPPPMAARVLAEATRVAAALVVIDLARPPSVLHLVKLATMAPLAPVWPFAHDGLISSLRAYSSSALRALGEHVGVQVDIRPAAFDRQVAVARRR